MAGTSHKEIELESMHREIQSLEEILRTLDNTNEIVHGFAIASLKQSASKCSLSNTIHRLNIAIGHLNIAAAPSRTINDESNILQSTAP